VAKQRKCESVSHEVLHNPNPRFGVPCLIDGTTEYLPLQRVWLRETDRGRVHAFQYIYRPRTSSRFVWATKNGLVKAHFATSPVDTIHVLLTFHRMQWTPIPPPSSLSKRCHVQLSINTSSDVRWLAFTRSVSPADIRGRITIALFFKLAL